MPRRQTFVRALLMPLSGFYGAAVWLRNWLFDSGLRRRYAFPIPIVTVGNITVGGTGKTPLIEYLIRLLCGEERLCVLSRGYKRRSRGLVVATQDSTIDALGDESYQIKKKFPAVCVAVDSNRCRAIRHLISGDKGERAEVVLLDDAYQYRCVQGDLSIVLIDYHRLPQYDYLLPAGRLREPRCALQRADIIVVTKCPATLSTAEATLLSDQLSLLPQQQLFFSTITYKMLRSYKDGREEPLSSINSEESVLLVLGIACPAQVVADLSCYTPHIHALTYSDHHYFSARDIARITAAYDRLDGRKRLLTTEKDAARLRLFAEAELPFINDLYILSIETTFLFSRQEAFNGAIRTYIKTNKK